MLSPKLASWDGPNKARVRLYKKHEIQQLVSMNREADWEPKMLSFAGPTATLERLLVNHRLIKPNNITTIQTYERLSSIHHGEPLLRKLINTRKRHLGGMKIWPYNFQSFAKCYGPDGCIYPSRSKQAKWSKKPYKWFMDQVIKDAPEKFSVLDLDLCGIFSRKTADSIESLFKNDLLNPSGLMFVTHQKGRDVRSGQLMDTLLGYLRTSDYLEEGTMDILLEEFDETYLARYILIPLYYMSKAFDHGYTLCTQRLIEYRDISAGSQNAVNMLQFFFRWKKATLMSDPNGAVKYYLTKVLEDEYPYSVFL